MDALTIIQRAVNRGTGQVELVRAATACLRSVAPLASWSQVQVVTALEAAERWSARPSSVNAGLALHAVPNLDGLHEKDPADLDVCLLLASALAALSAANVHFASLTAVMAVEHAEKAAAGRGIDLTPLVTAELL